MIPLIVIAGPTASGKTALAIETAKRLNGEIISADSMQIYKKMNIGTAKPDEAEKSGIPHYMLDIKEPWENFSVGEFASMTHEIIKSITERGKISVLAGGTGLYIDNVVYNIKLSEESHDDKIRKELEKQALEQGSAALLAELAEKDPKTAEKLHENDIKRIIRALEILKLTGKTKSQHDEESKNQKKIYNTFYFAIELPREILYNRINMRVDKMLEAGLEDEAYEIYNLVRKSESTSLQSVGYKELYYYFRGLATKNESIELIKKNTRHLAKRQMTWFGKNKDIIWLDGTKPMDKLVDAICDTFYSKGYEQP